MKKVQAARYIKQLVALNQIQRALSDLLSFIGPSESGLYNELILLSGFFARTKEDKNKGILSKDDERLNYAKLSSAIIEIADQLPVGKVIEIPSREKVSLDFRTFLQKFGQWVIIGIWLLLATIGFWGLFSLQKPIDINLTLLVSRASFELLQETKFEINESIQALQMQNFQQVKSPAKEISIESDINRALKKMAVNGGLVYFLPSENEMTSSVLLRNLEIAFLKISANARLIFDYSSQDGSTVFYIEVTSGYSKGQAIFQDSLDFDGQYFFFNQFQKEIPLFSNWLGGTIYLPKDEVQELTFLGNEDQFSLIIESEKPLDAIREKAIKASEFLFIRPGQPGVAVSSIEKGILRFVDSQKRPFEDIEIISGEFLKLKNSKYLEINDLKVLPEGIELRINGRVESVLAGTDPKSLASQNPSRFNWWWTNHFPVMLLFSFMAIVITLSISIVNKSRF